jgi:hypothetical protein
MAKASPVSDRKSTSHSMMVMELTYEVDKRTQCLKSHCTLWNLLEVIKV